MAEMEVDPNNGLIIKGIYVPEEVLVLILSNLDAKSIVKFRQVCKCWKEIGSGPVWHEKAIREIPGLHRSFFRHHKLPWVDYFWLCHKKPFLRNMIKNGSGEEKFKHWTITNGGNGWSIERNPEGTKPLPKNFPSCFVTSFEDCSAEQMIDLHKEGLSQTVMDELNPVISISDWYAGRWDCGVAYKLAVSLLNSEWEVLKTFQFKDRLEKKDRDEWRNVKHEFRDYGKGVHYINFYRCGKDTQFWAGHYGAKMTGAEVIISMPEEPSSSEKRNSKIDNRESC